MWSWAWVLSRGVCLVASDWLFVTLWTVTHQAPLSMEFFRREYLSGEPFSSLGDLLTQESNPGLPHCRQILYCLSVGLPRWHYGKEPTCQGDVGSVTGWGRSPGEGNGNPLQYSRLKNSMDRGTWWATVHGFPKEWYWKDNGEKPRFLSLKIICHLLGFSCFWWIFILFSFTVSEKQIQPQRKHGHLWSTYYFVKNKKSRPFAFLLS